MDKIVKRGLDAYIIFLKNRIAGAGMMLMSGVMMFIAALNGHGNDTKSLPALITSLGGILTFWGACKLGYIKSNLDKISKTDREKRSNEKKIFYLQIAETLVYLLIVGLGVLLLTNEFLTNKVLNLMAGGFTTLNGVLNAISTFKNRENRDFHWKLMAVMMVLELVIGPYFIFGSDSISINGYIVMGVLTTVAGTIEVISALTRENLKRTLNDGKEIVRIIKDDKGSNNEKQPEKNEKLDDKQPTEKIQSQEAEPQPKNDK